MMIMSALQKLHPLQLLRLAPLHALKGVCLEPNKTTVKKTKPRDDGGDDDDHPRVEKGDPSATH